MTSTQIAAPVTIRNVLYLTDFSPSSEAALPFAIAVARKYAASVEVLHVLTPVIPESCSDAIKADEALAEAEIERVRPRIVGVRCKTTLARNMGLWEAIERAIMEHHIDLIVAGTHGRTGVPKLLLVSVAEEVFRRSPVPVLTVGPHGRENTANCTRFNQVLFATDFSTESEAAAAYAVSLAQENSAHLIVLNVMRKSGPRNPAEVKAFEASVAWTTERLYQSVPSDAALCNPAEIVVEYGEPADRIVEVARERGSDVIVLGVRNATGHLGAATHLERATAHKVVIHSPCPVLTVRPRETGGLAAERTEQ